MTPVTKNKPLEGHAPQDAASDPARQIARLVRGNAQDITEAAALLEIETPEAEAFLELHADAIRAEALRMRTTGESLPAQAARIVAKLLDRIEQVADTVDAFDAADLLKHPLRILEARDRRDQAKRGEYENLPVFNFVFNYAALPGEPMVEVVDVKASALDGGAA